MMTIGTTKADSSSRNTGCGLSTLITKVSASGASIDVTGARVTLATAMR
jgi:hypothetical protein